MWDKRAKLLRVKDGDTVVVVLDQGFGDSKEVDIRLLGVWAPESNQTGGKETKEFVEGWFAKLPSIEWNFVVTTVRMKTVDKEQKTFDRYVGFVTSQDGTDNLNTEVMEFIHSRGYGGGTGS